MNKVARIVSGKIVYGDSSEIVKPHEMASHARRRDMKINHRKDLLQRNQVDYYKAYPNQAKNLNPNLRRLLS